MSDISDETAGAAETAHEDPTPATPEGDRIAKIIARAGIASRRDAEAMIEAGRVTLNGTRLTSPAVNVTASDRITVDGEPLPSRERTRLWILHKPRGVVTTARDPQGRQTVFEGLPDDLPRVVAIGRLDINTEGLLLLTNDGGLAKVIAHPDTGWLRRYRVRAFGEITQPDLDKLRKGVTIDGMEYGPVEASLDRVQGDNVWLTLGLREGKNREVKRILEYLGLSVNRLIRLSFGPFQLGDLEVGLVEEIRTKVLKEQLGKTLAELAGVDFDSPVREPIAPFGKPKKPAAEVRPRKQEARSSERPPRRAPVGGNGRPGRDPARPAAVARTPTGGMGPGPRQSIWRAEEADGERPHGTRIPRRGADPKAARVAAAERGRERVGAIKAAGDRRVLVERLQASPEVPAAEPHRRVRFHKRDDEQMPRSSAGRPPRGEARPRHRDDDAPPRRPRGDERAAGGRAHDRPRSAGPHARSFERDRAAPDKSGGRPDRGRREERGEKPDRGRFRPESGRPGGRAGGGGRPGGWPGGGKSGPRGGGRPPRGGSR